jgi:hypothetical protein
MKILRIMNGTVMIKIFSALLVGTLILKSSTIACSADSSRGSEVLEDSTYALAIRSDMTVTAHFRITQDPEEGTVYFFEFHSAANPSVQRTIIDTVTEYWGPAFFRFLDLTFDGYLDFRIPVDVDGHGDNWSRTYIFDPIHHEYVLCTTCDDMPWDIKLDTLNKRIRSEQYSTYADEFVTRDKEYRIANNMPVLIKNVEHRFPRNSKEQSKPRHGKKRKKKN